MTGLGADFVGPFGRAAASERVQRLLIDTTLVQAAEEIDRVYRPARMVADFW